VGKIDNVLLHRGYLAIENEMIAWTTLQEIQDVGLIGKIGISAANPGEAKLAFELPGCEVVQVASSLLDQRLTRSNFFGECQAKGIETFVRSIFLQGIAFIAPEDLSGKLVELREILLSIKHFAAEFNLTAADIWKTFASDINTNFLVVGVTNDWELQRYLEHENPNMKELIRTFSNQIDLLPEYILDPSRWNGLESSRLFEH
jgi:aryl-alcohol dehydrogenase-like predicted oxidoreductase